MKLLVDMNLSPEWIEFLADNGFESTHWSKIGTATAPDIEILEFAGERGYVVLTQDLDFGSILAATRLKRPSVVQIRSDDLDYRVIGKLVLAALSEASADLESGALITVDPRKYRLRLLPFTSR